MLRSVCCDALNPFGTPGAIALHHLGVNAVRIQARQDPRYFSYAAYLRKHGFQVITVLDHDSFSGTDYGSDVALYEQQFVPDLLVIGNEEDAWILEEQGADISSSWAMKPEEYAPFFVACASNTSAPTCIGGLVSGQPDVVPHYLQAISAISNAWIPGIDLHPYGKNANETVDLLVEYQKNITPGMCPYILEWNRPAKEIDEYVSAIEPVVWGHSFFCFSGGMAPELGLKTPSGSPKKVYYALRDFYRS